MPEIPVFLTNVTTPSGEHNGRGEFMCTMQSVVLGKANDGTFVASIVQQPPESVAGERPSQLTPWIMPTWTYDYANAATEWDAAPRSLRVGDELVVGNLATNFATVRVEEVQQVHTLTNSSGTSVVCASGYVPDDALPTGAAFQREIVSGLMFYIDSPQVDITTYHTEIVALLNDRALATNNPCVFFASGHQRRGNRVYCFVRVVDETTNANAVAIRTLDANLRSLVDGGLVVSGAYSVIPLTATSIVDSAASFSPFVVDNIFNSPDAPTNTGTGGLDAYLVLGGAMHIVIELPPGRPVGVVEVWGGFDEDEGNARVPDFPKRVEVLYAADALGPWTLAASHFDDVVPASYGYARVELSTRITARYVRLQMSEPLGGEDISVLSIAEVVMSGPVDDTFVVSPKSMPRSVAPLITDIGPSIIVAHSAPRYLRSNDAVELTGFRARLWGATGGSGEFDTSTWINDWLAGSGVASFAYRVSQPLNLNTFTPCHATLKQNKPSQIYSVDAKGVANALFSYAPEAWPFLTLASRSHVQQIMWDSGQKYHEKFLWPTYRQRRGLATGAETENDTFIVPLQNDGKRPRHISLLSYSIAAPLTNAVVVRIDGVGGQLQSNNTTVNGAFAVLRMTSDAADAHRTMSGDSIRSEARPIASAPVDTTVRQMRVRFYDLSGHELKNLLVSLWFSVQTS